MVERRDVILALYTGLLMLQQVIMTGVKILITCWSHDITHRSHDQYKGTRWLM